MLENAADDRARPARQEWLSTRLTARRRVARLSRDRKWLEVNIANEESVDGGFS
jgi:hypothetical protein